MTTASSAVFLSNVDDYLSPSQACVNPLYSDTGDTTSTAPQPPTTNQVVPRKRVRSRRIATVTSDDAATTPTVSSSANNNDNDNTSKNKVTASIADCLACSGCITTAETVLLQNHSLEQLRRVLFADDDDDNNATAAGRRQDETVLRESHRQRPIVVATISPASMADLARMMTSEEQEQEQQSQQKHLAKTSNGDDTTTDQRQHQQQQLHIVNLLSQLLGIDAVLDGNYALEWSLQAAAREFIDRTRRRGMKEHQEDHRLEQHDESEPLITSTCPAVVCLVEKNHHTVVPLLSTTKSPFMAAAQVMSDVVSDVAADNCHAMDGLLLFHLAIMPCHDKKLEASRWDQEAKSPSRSGSSSSSSKPVTTMVITTDECWQLLQERQQQQHTNVEMMSTLESHALRCPNASLTLTNDWRRSLQELLRRRHNGVRTESDTKYYIIKAEKPIRDDMDIEMDDCPGGEDHVGDGNAMDIADAAALPQPGNPFPYTSGGYADYIFRQAARELYGVVLDCVPWRSVSNASATMASRTNGGSSSTVSARVARSRTQRDFWVATLYQKRLIDGSGQCEYSMDADLAGDSSTTPVLRFAMAHGMQTMQRAITDMRGSFDYIEAMACPSGCLNGGGQVRVGGGLGREAPRDTQARLQLTREHFIVSKSHDATNFGAEATICESKGPFDMHTSFRKVPPMQLSMGAGKGMAVKDIQW